MHAFLLRASGEGDGSGSDIAVVRDAKAADRSRVPHAGELVAFAEAVLGRDDLALSGARESLRRCVGDQALVDAAAVVGNFQRMVRVADATGISLDSEIRLFTQDIQSELELGKFGSAVNTKPLSAWKRILAQHFGPLLLRGANALYRMKKKTS